MRYAGLVKLILLIFVGVAIYNYNKSKIESKSKEISEQFSKAVSLLTAEPLPVIQEESDANTSKLKTATSEDSSFIERKVAGIISQAMRTPEGKEIVQSVLKNLESQDELTKDILLKNFHFNDIAIGAGIESACGHEVVIEYYVSKIDDNKDVTANIVSKKEKSTFKIGSGALPENLEKAVLGMKKGGSRKIIFAKSKIALLKKEPLYQSNVTLIDINNTTEIIPKNKIFSKNIDQTTESMRSFTCGESVLLSYEIRDIKDNVIYDSNKLPGGTKSIKIGSNKIPQEISATMDNLPVGHRIFITIPSKELVNMKFLEVPNDLVINEEIVVVSLLPHF
jgi:hypothetical protein